MGLLNNIADKADDAITALMKQARKYKMPDEFVEAQGQTMFRASRKPFDIKLMRDDGIFLSPSREYVKFWQKAQGYKNLEEFVIAPNAKILRQKDFPSKYIKKEGGYTFTSLDDQAALVEYAKAKGFDGIEFYSTKAGKKIDHEFAIWNNDAFKTKAQLTDIWNKANAKKVLPAVILAGSLMPSANSYADQWKNYKNTEPALQEPLIDPTTLLAGPARWGGGLMNMGIDSALKYITGNR